jgi:MFS family permease
MQPKRNNELKTNWPQVCSLMALNLAIVFSWMAYHNYQTQLLTLFHVEQLTLFLVVAQAVILVFIPGIAGFVGDYVIRKNGNYLVVFTVGISITAMVFMCIAFTVGGLDILNLTGVVPILIVVWLISMNIFHSPANSMLELFAPAKALPTAMALMVLSTELLYALEPWIVDFVEHLGAAYTFGLGAVLLLVTGYFFRKTTLHITLSRDVNEANAPKSNYANLLVAGLALGLATATINNFVPAWMLSKKGIELISLKPSVYISFILLVAALAAWPLSLQVNKTGITKGLKIGLVGTFTSCALVYLLPAYAAVAACAATALCFSFASITAFPYALKNLSPKNVTLGAGLFFGSVEVAQGLISLASNL